MGGGPGMNVFRDIAPGIKYHSYMDLLKKIIMHQSVKLTGAIWLLQLVITSPFFHALVWLQSVSPLGFERGSPGREADDLPTELSLSPAFDLTHTLHFLQWWKSSITNKWSHLYITATTSTHLTTFVCMLHHKYPKFNHFQNKMNGRCMYFTIHLTLFCGYLHKCLIRINAIYRTTS